jgi:hypothetical protein
MLLLILDSFYNEYVTFLGLNSPNKKTLKFIMTWGMSILVPLFALFIQTYLEFEPIVRLCSLGWCGLPSWVNI